MEKAIEFLSVSKTFTKRSFKNTLLRRAVSRVVALEDVSFCVDQGQVYGLLGPNGAGKTTLVKLIAGLISADIGTIKLFGQKVGEDSHHVALANVGMVNNNDRTFYWRLSGRQNLDFFATLHDLPPKVKKYKINELLAQLNLEEIADRTFMTYSSGQKQRFAIARSLINDPKILLFDEATSNIDPISSKKLLKFVKDVLVNEKKRTVLWCTHNLAEAEKLCDNMAILHKGRLITQGTLDELQGRFSTTTQFSIIVGNWHDALSTHLTVQPDAIEKDENSCTNLTFKCKKNMLPSILRDLIKNQIDVYNCSPKTMRLEEIFDSNIFREN